MGEAEDDVPHDHVTLTMADDEKIYLIEGRYDIYLTYLFIVTN